MVMNRRIIEHFLFVLFVCLMNYDGVRGKKLLNKPPIKTIKIEYGYIYDCVNFYDQPAFHHPLLKNHNYHPQMKPSLFMKESDPIASTSDTSSSQPMGLPDGGCPVGTVPIRRYTKEDLIRQKLLPPPEDNSNVIEPPLTNRDNFNDSKARRIKPLKGYKLAIVTTEDNPHNQFGGASMIAAIYNPRSTGQQHSACRLKLIKGKNIIQTGWRVDPTLYGDNRTRVFIHFDDGTNSCFDLLCPSFVMDYEKGNWWLILEVSRDNHVPIGFWPKEVFDEFWNFATRVEWGGVVYSPAGVIEPPMGSGLYPLMKNTKVNAYCRVVTLLDANGENIDILGSKLPTFSTTPMLYGVIDVPDYGGYDYNHTILYGGPGEN